jgi:hypothetical protein
MNIKINIPGRRSEESERKRQLLRKLRAILTKITMLENMT